MDNIEEKAKDIAKFLKCIGNPDRLKILCQLVDGEKSVTELIDATEIAQTSMSQHLSKLKRENIVTFRRDHRTLYYSISNNSIFKVMNLLRDEFCK